MFKKVPLVIVVFGYILLSEVCFADVSAELKQAKSSVISLIKDDKYSQAQEQAQKLLTDFPKDPDLPKVLYEIAEGYRWSFKSDRNKYEYARIFYQQVMKRYPDSPFANKAALGVAKIKVLSNIMAQDFNAAGQALNEMVADFQNDPNLPDELYWIGRGYGYWERHEEEKNVYQRIIQNYPDSSYVDKARIGFAKANVQSLIISKDYDGAKQALDKLTADFSKHVDLHEALYWIAVRYVWSNRFEDGKRIYQQVIQNFPDSPRVSSAKLDFSRADVLSRMQSQDYKKAKEALDKMIKDFKDSPDLPEALFTMGRQCYDQGLSKQEEGIEEKAKDHFGKAARIWDRLINEFPESPYIPEAACWAGDCYFSIDKYEDSKRCFQKVVDNYPQYEYAWHAQFKIGRCYEELKNTGAIESSIADAQIKAACEQLLIKYPNCDAAESARIMRDSLMLNNKESVK
jgi:TolA-binding protein